MCDKGGVIAVNGVWCVEKNRKQVLLDVAYLEQVKTELSLTNYHNVTDNEILIRYVSEEKVLKNSQSVEPELSDYYLFINQKENI